MPRIARTLTHRRILTAVVGLVGLLPLSTAMASERIILNCGSSAIDEASLAECVALTAEQAEVRLEQVEDAWRNFLQGTYVAQDVDLQTDAPERQSAEESQASSNDEPVAQDTGVIAIVNDSALRSGIATAGVNVLNVDESQRDESTRATLQEADERFEQTVDNTVDIKERFGFLPALFRSFRDQHCALRASISGSDRQLLVYQACLAEMTEDRARVLTRDLAIQRAEAQAGTSFRGYYAKTDRGAFFQACGRRTDWWVDGSESVLSALDRRYLDIKSQSPGTTDLLYTELRGDLVAAPVEGAGADFISALSVRSFAVMRPVADTDCNYRGTAPQTSSDQNIDVNAAASNFATVDDYAASGFLYGYFNYWLAACSVTQNSVCSAESEAEFASDGDWKLRIDRALTGDWRIMLVPTTEDQLIEKQLTLQINGADILLNKTFAQPLRLPLKKGVEIAVGANARELVAKLRQGSEVRFQWFNEADVMSELKFSLVGVTRALQYFDSDKS